MKRWVKVTLITVCSLVVLIGGVIGGYFILLNSTKDKPVTTEKPNELILIENLADEVYKTLPNETSTNLTFKKNFEGYEEFKIVYSSNNSPYMNNEGIINRDEENHVVTLKFTISYKDFSQEFGKNITVLKTSGMESMSNIVNIIRNEVTPNIPNNFVLPTKVTKYENATISWKEDVINQTTGLVEPTIKVNYIDEQYVVEFSKAETKEICFLEAVIEYQGSTLEQRFVVYTKTTI